MSSSAITGPILSDARRAPAGTAAAPSFAFNDSTGTGVYLVSPGVLGLSTAGVQRVVVDASGNVGIGTASPTKKLHVNGDVQIGNNEISGGGTIELNAGGTGDRNAVIDFHSSGAPGTVDFSSRIIRTPSVTGEFIFANTGTGPIRFDLATAERMRLDASGNLLVGTTSVLAGGPKAHIAGSIACYGYLGRAGTAGTFSNAFNINWTGSAQLWIDATNVGTISLTSDYRIKKNVETQEQPALERIAQLRPVKYEFADYKELFKADGVQREGFIAHELQEVIPSAVEGEKDAEEQIQSLKLDALCSVMVKAIQEQQAQIEKQSQALEALKAEVAALKAP